MEKDMMGGSQMGGQKLKTPDELGELTDRLSQKYAGLPAGRRAKLIEMHLRAVQLADVAVEPSRVSLGSENLSKEFSSELFQRSED